MSSQNQFSYLILGPGTKLTSSWFIALANVLQQLQNQINEAVTFYDLYNLPSDIIPAIDDLYNLGAPDAAWANIYAYYGYFDDNVYVQGKQVLKDGDPVNIYEFFPIAQEQIVQAIEEATPPFQFDQYYDLKVNVAQPTDEYGNVNVDVQQISPAAQSQLTAAFQQALPRLNIDQYGNVGIIIEDPLDAYGRVKVSTDEKFEPVSASGSVQAANNTSGLTVVLQSNGRPNVNVYYNVGGSATIYVQVSNDGASWKTLDTISTSGSASGIKIYTGIAYRYVQVTTSTTGIDIEFEISASR